MHAACCMLLLLRSQVERFLGSPGEVAAATATYKRQNAAFTTCYEAVHAKSKMNTCSMAVRFHHSFFLHPAYLAALVTRPPKFLFYLFFFFFFSFFSSSLFVLSASQGLVTASAARRACTVGLRKEAAFARAAVLQSEN